MKILILMVVSSVSGFVLQTFGQGLVLRDGADVVPLPGMNLRADLAFGDQVKVELSKRKMFSRHTAKEHGMNDRNTAVHVVLTSLGNSPFVILEIPSGSIARRRREYDMCQVPRCRLVRQAGKIEIRPDITV